MKIRVSRLRKIINEEIRRCLFEAEGDAATKAAELKIASLEKQKNDAETSAAEHRAAIARIKKDTADKELAASTQAAQTAQSTTADVPVTESDDLDEFWPTVARAAGSYAAGKLSDRLLDEDEERDGLSETIKKINGKWCLLSKKSERNLGCYDDRAGAENREREVNYFKKRDK
jgi:hypothetical protein